MNKKWIISIEITWLDNKITSVDVDTNKSPEEFLGWLVDGWARGPVFTLIGHITNNEHYDNYEVSLLVPRDKVKHIEVL